MEGINGIFTLPAAEGFNQVVGCYEDLVSIETPSTGQVSFINMRNQTAPYPTTRNNADKLAQHWGQYNQLRLGWLQQQTIPAAASRQHGD